MNRIIYPTRNAVFRKDLGLPPEKVELKLTQRDKLQRLLQHERDCLYCKTLVVESLADFKKRFGI